MSDKKSITITVNGVLNVGPRARFVVLENGVALEIKDDTGNWVRQNEWTK